MLKTIDSSPFGFVSSPSLDDVYTGAGFTDPSSVHDLRDDLRELRALFLDSGMWPTRSIAATALAVAVRPGTPIPTSVMYVVEGVVSAASIASGWQWAAGESSVPYSLAGGLPDDNRVVDRVAAAIARLYIMKIGERGWQPTLRQLDACLKIYTRMARQSDGEPLIAAAAGDLALGLHGLAALHHELGEDEREPMWGDEGLCTLMAREVHRSMSGATGALTIAASPVPMRLPAQ